MLVPLEKPSREIRFADNSSALQQKAEKIQKLLLEARKEMDILLKSEKELRLIKETLPYSATECRKPIDWACSGIANIIRDMK